MQLPELEEHFTLFLLNATNGATVVENEDSHTTLVINKNDDAVYFKGIFIKNIIFYYNYVGLSLNYTLLHIAIYQAVTMLS